MRVMPLDDDVAIYTQIRAIFGVTTLYVTYVLACIAPSPGWVMHYYMYTVQ